MWVFFILVWQSFVEHSSENLVIYSFVFYLMDFDQTVKGGYSETRIEKRIIITGDDDVDQHQVGGFQAAAVDNDNVKGFWLAVVLSLPGSCHGHPGGQAAASRHAGDKGRGHQGTRVPYRGGAAAPSSGTTPAASAAAAAVQCAGTAIAAAGSTKHT